MIGTLLGVGAAAAQSPPDFTGTWSFQSAPYDFARDGSAYAALSGTAVIRRTSNNAYDIDLVAQEIAFVGAPGEVNHHFFGGARQLCRGQAVAQQLNITCTVVSANPGYSPDEFVVTAQADGTLLGSFNNRQVETLFVRLD
ncbi:MAG: hypothetical protein AB7Q23_13130 [Hyphomonadaceae bacterium]